MNVLFIVKLQKRVVRIDQKHNIASSVLTMMMKISNYNDLLYNNNYKYLLLIELIYLFLRTPVLSWILLKSNHFNFTQFLDFLTFHFQCQNQLLLVHLYVLPNISKLSTNSGQFFTIITHFLFSPLLENSKYF